MGAHLPETLAAMVSDLGLYLDTATTEAPCGAATCHRLGLRLHGTALIATGVQGRKLPPAASLALHLDRIAGGRRHGPV